MIIYDHAQRYTADESLKHPWITKSDSTDSPLKPVDVLKCYGTQDKIKKVFQLLFQN